MLIGLVVRDFRRYFTDATAGGWRWTDLNFQEHYRTRARRALQSLNTLLDFARAHEFVRDDSERGVLVMFVTLLRDYLSRKTTVPTPSRWFGETYEHRQWYLTESTAIGMASETARPLTPTTVPDASWVEKALFSPVLKAIAEDMRAERGESAYVVLSSLPRVFEEFGLQFAANDGFEWVAKATEHVMEALGDAPEESTNPEQVVPWVAGIDRLAGLPVAIEVGLYKRLSRFDVSSLAAKLESTPWAHDDSPYGLGLPRPVVERWRSCRWA